MGRLRVKHRYVGTCLMALVFIGAEQAAGQQDLKTGYWNCHLASPGGELSFGLLVERVEDEPRCYWVNPPERIRIPSVRSDGKTLTFEMPHYDSAVTAKLEDNATRLVGSWRKRVSLDKWAELPFAAVWRTKETTFIPPPGVLPSSNLDAFRELAHQVSGRFEVRFSGSQDLAVGIFEVDELTGQATGTFLTPSGDYRYLAGSLKGGDLKDKLLTLSCFDGAHAFLFKASLMDDRTLKGDFWSGDAWHETWTGRKNPDVSLPDPFNLTKSTDRISWKDLVFPDVHGEQTRLGDDVFEGKARILYLFGTWCPNCEDATNLLVRLHDEFVEQGLAIVGLAFELTGDFSRDAAQVKRYAARHGSPFPVFLAGMADKAKASESFPLLDQIRAFPTFVFIDAKGDIVAVYTGFNGPATGKEHDRTVEQIRKLVISGIFGDKMEK